MTRLPAVIARAALLLVLLSISAAALAPTAQAADALLGDSRTLFLTERFRADAMRAPLGGGVQPEQLMAMRGEHEGFQLAVRNDTGGSLALQARVVPDAPLGAELRSGRIGVDLLRVATVLLPRGSTGLGTPGGRYADPLPPFGSGSAGLLHVAPRAWGGVVLLARVETGATPAVYSGNLELVQATPQGEFVRARRAFTLDVRPGTLLRPGTPRSFKTVLDVESPVYWLQHSAMRNGPPAYPTSPDRMRQLAGLFSFLDSRGVTPLNTPFAAPSQSGGYSCEYDSPGAVGPISFRAQLGSRYFGPVRSVDPQSRQFRSRFVPDRTSGCDPERAGDEFAATFDRRRTPGVKQDDYLHPRFGAFTRAVSAAWRDNGWFTRSTYALNPFDEPSDVTAAQRYTMNTQVPAANTLLHRAHGANAKVVLASWPRDERRQRICRRFSSGTSCITASRDQYGNRRMWDGRGLDDVDVWMPQFGRLFGRTTTATLARYGHSRNREYANRLAAIRRAKAGRETWAYNFYTATRQMPQLSIDAPGTDARLQYWLLAREGHTGLFVSNTMLGWASAPRTFPNGLRFKGDPWDQATYFEHRRYGYAAGWGTFIYPGYRPELGLASEAQRNTEQARPVTSLRMEGMRDGQEDANLVAMYRSRFGAAAVGAQMRAIFPGGYRALPASHGSVVFPTWSNRNLAQRLEARRRAMILRLTA